MSDWQEFLAARGARQTGAGESAAELDAAASGHALAALTHLGMLRISGDDARAFLHGQLSCDVAELGDERAVYGCYCTAKGRMLASVLLWHEADGFRMVLAGDITASVRKRLMMYVLRAKVVIDDLSEAAALLGIAGVDDVPAGVPLPGPVDEALAAANGVTAIRLRGNRLLVATHASAAPALWDVLCGAREPVGTAAWRWLEIVNGLPLVTLATQEQFVPQMVNMELIGGVNFRKGCYPGQEIVARTQYLGKVKRRMYLAHVAGGAPVAGDPLFSEDVGEQSNGMIVNAAPAPGGGTDVLAVVQAASAAESTVHLRSPDGPVLAFRPLPYAVT